MEAQEFILLRFCFVRFQRPEFGTINPERETDRDHASISSPPSSFCFSMT